jgi:hypothetical protein
MSFIRTEILVLRQAQDEDFLRTDPSIALILSLSKDEGGPRNA